MTARPKRDQHNSVLRPPGLRMLFCADPLNPGHPDPAYDGEMLAAQQAGIDCDLINFEALVDDGDAQRAVRRVTPTHDPITGVYRGWMLRPERYGALYAALADRGIRLLNDPTAYALCHHLPSWYPMLSEWTPRSSWLRTDGDISDEQLAGMLRGFSGRPAIVKDFVKSQKHR